LYGHKRRHGFIFNFSRVEEAELRAITTREDMVEKLRQQAKEKRREAKEASNMNEAGESTATGSGEKRGRGGGGAGNVGSDDDEEVEGDDDASDEHGGGDIGDGGWGGKRRKVVEPPVDDAWLEQEMMEEEDEEEEKEEEEEVMEEVEEGEKEEEDEVMEEEEEDMEEELEEKEAGEGEDAGGGASSGGAAEEMGEGGGVTGAGAAIVDGVVERPAASAGAVVALKREAGVDPRVEAPAGQQPPLKKIKVEAVKAEAPEEEIAAGGVPTSAAADDEVEELAVDVKREDTVNRERDVMIGSSFTALKPSRPPAPDDGGNVSDGDDYDEVYPFDEDADDADVYACPSCDFQNLYLGNAFALGDICCHRILCGGSMKQAGCKQWFCLECGGKLNGSDTGHPQCGERWQERRKLRSEKRKLQPARGRVHVME
jgi:hypothetical protein